MSNSYDERDFAPYESDARGASDDERHIDDCRAEIGRIEGQIAAYQTRRAEAQSHIARVSEMVSGLTIRINRGRAIAGTRDGGRLDPNVRTNLANRSGVVARLIMAEPNWVTVGLCIVFTDSVDGQVYALLHRGANYRID